MDTVTLWFLGITIFVLVSACVFLFYSSISKGETLRAMQEANQKLTRSLEELDEQAKMIVRTDIELNKFHEEMDKRLDGLNALQRMSRQMSQALNKNEIFQSISARLFEDLGFSRCSSRRPTTTRP